MDSFFVFMERGNTFKVQLILSYKKRKDKKKKA
jgi:hypothetical protein